MNPNPFYYDKFFSCTGIFTEFIKSYKYPWEAIGHIDDFILNFKESKHSEGFYEIEKNVFVGKNVLIDDTARIIGGAILGDNTTIGHAAFLRGGVLLGENVNVGHATEVKHSIVFSNSALAHLNYIGDSIIGSNNNISGGATLANWRFDKKEINVANGDEKIPTHMTKFGSILGDDCFVGINAVINPGTVMSKGSLVFPLVSVKGTHLSRETFK